MRSARRAVLVLGAFLAVICLGLSRTRPPRPTGPEELTDSAGIQLVAVPAGEFLMGSKLD
jgi:hypothetical protein